MKKIIPLFFAIAASVLSVFAGEGTSIAYIGSTETADRRVWFEQENPQKFSMKFMPRDSNDKLSSASLSNPPERCSMTEDGMFSYSPTASDISPFTVEAIFDTEKLGRISQSFLITPEPQEKNSYKLFCSPNQSFPPPDTESRDYVSYLAEIEQGSDGKPSSRFHNGKSRTNLRTITVSGLNVIFKPGHENGLFEKISATPYKGQEPTAPDAGNAVVNADITELEIYADTLTIDAPLWIPGANVKVFARTAKFALNTCIDTRPLDYIDQATNASPARIVEDPVTRKNKIEAATPGADGLPGQKAGDILFAVETANYQAGGIQLFAMGGRGQPGGKGFEGLDGDKIPRGSEKGPVQTIREWPQFWEYSGRRAFFASCWAMPSYTELGVTSGSYIIYNDNPKHKAVEDYFKAHTVAATYRISMNGWSSSGYVKNWEADESLCVPRNGTDAVRPGKAGKGGNGGRISSSSPLMICNCGGFYADGQPKSSGGKAGTPNPAYYMICNSSGRPSIGDGYSNEFWVGKVWISQAGNDAAAESCEERGAAGEFIDNYAASNYAFVHPRAAQKALEYIIEAWQNERTDYAKELATRWSGLLNSAIKNKAWEKILLADLPKDEQKAASGRYSLEYSRLKSEMDKVLNDIANQLDCYGNPIGWAPMLSLEINTEAYRQQTDYAIRVMALNAWLKQEISNNENRLSGLAQQASYCLSRMKSLKAEQENIGNSVNDLTVINNTTLTQVESFAKELEAKEKELLEKAKSEVKKQRILKVVSGGLKFISSVIPYGQPLLGQITGGVMETVENSINGDVPGSIIAGGTGILKTFAEKDNISTLYNKEFWKGSFGDYKNYYATPDKGASKEDKWYWKVNYAKENPIGDWMTGCATSGATLGNSITGLARYSGDNAASDKDIQAMLENLKKQSPEYSKLAENLSTLNKSKQAVAESIIKLQSRISQNATEAQTTILTLDAAAQETLRRKDGQIASAKLNAYMEELDCRAEADLAKFHYYMRKSYEYRLLKPYPWGAFNPKKIREEISALIIASGGKNLTDADFEKIRTVYDSEMKEVGNQLFKDINENKLEKVSDTQYTYEFHQAQLDALNRGEDLFLNLADTGLFAGKKALRILEIEIDKSSEIEKAAWLPSVVNSTFDLTLSHPGVSFLTTSAGIRYAFRHMSGESKSSQSIRWGASYSSSSGTLSPIKPSEDSNSLIRYLVGADKDIAIFSRFGMDTSLIVRKSAEKKEKKSSSGTQSDCLGLDGISGKMFASALNDSELQAFSIKSLKINVKYSYVEQGASIAELRLLASDGFEPFVLIDIPDKDQNQSGRGEFSRFYEIGTALTLQVPSSLDSAKFVRWTDSQGSSSPFKDPTNPVLELEIDSDTAIWPHYEYQIEGRIMKKEGGAAFGTMLSVSDETGNSMRGYVEDVNLGTYALSGLGTGTYTVTPTLPGYSFKPTLRTVKIPEEIPIPLDFSAISSTATYEIRGRIQMDGNRKKALGGATAILTRTVGADTWTVQTLSGDYDGVFCFLGIPDGAYSLTVVYDGRMVKSNSNGLSTITLNSLKAKAKSGRVTFDETAKDPLSFIAYPLSSSLKGTVTVSPKTTGLSPENVIVSAKPLDANLDPNVFTQKLSLSADGKYEFFLMGEYEITAEKTLCQFKPARHKIKITEKDLKGYDFEMSSAGNLELFSISGQISGEFKNSFVSICDENGRLLQKQPPNPDGSFEFKELSQGRHSISIRGAGLRFRPEVRIVQVSCDNPEILNFNGRTRTAVDDFDGDGKSDAVLPDNRKGSPEGIFSPYELILSGDFNADGRTENLLASKNSIFYLDFSGLGQRGFGVKALIPQPLQGLVPITAGDFNGDRRDDLLFRDKDCHPVIVLLRNERTEVAKLANPAIHGMSVLGAGDFDGDGISDLLLHLQEGQGIIVLDPLNEGRLSTIGTSKGEVPSFRIGDFNGDGIDEIMEPIVKFKDQMPELKIP